MIIVTATLSFETQADRDRAVELTAPVQKATRDEEAGCLAYCFAADPSEPTHIQVYELWENQETLAAHFHHENYRAMGGSFRELLSGYTADHKKYRCDLTEPVYDNTGTPQAGFVIGG